MAYKGAWARKETPLEKALSVIGVILCIVFSLTLLCNLTIIIKGTIDPENPPSVLGITPLVVLSGSMMGSAPDRIDIGDMIFVGRADPEELEVGDVISYTQGRIVVTHRIIEINTDENGKRLFTTQGDANNTPDEMPVSEDALVGIVKHRLPKVGDFAMFLQTPLGMFLFVGVPLLAFVLYDILRRQHYAVKESKKTRQLQEEIARLKAAAAEKEKAQK